MDGWAIIDTAGFIGMTLLVGGFLLLLAWQGIEALLLRLHRRGHPRETHNERLRRLSLEHLARVRDAEFEELRRAKRATGREP